MVEVVAGGAIGKFAGLRQPKGFGALARQFCLVLFLPLAPDSTQGSFAVPFDIPSGPRVRLRPYGRGGVRGYRWDEGRSGLDQLVALVLVFL